jgi:hypothetical protein
MRRLGGISCWVMWLGPKRGHLTDWTTQLWVKTTGTITDLQSSPWLDGPIARPTGIGVHFFDDFAAEHGLSVQAGTGLIKNFAELRGPEFKAADIASEVRLFYENTAEYELDAWSEWCGFFRPFGYLLARVFSQRLQQLNVPLSGLDTSRGIKSRVDDLIDAGRNVRYTAWIRELLGNRHVLYAGSYSTCRVPNFDGVCVKVVFPLPNGNAIVIMYPQSEPDGSLLLTSSGIGYGSPGFYFTVREVNESGRSTCLRCAKRFVCTLSQQTKCALIISCGSGVQLSFVCTIGYNVWNQCKFRPLSSRETGGQLVLIAFTLATVN